MVEGVLRLAGQANNVSKLEEMCKSSRKIHREGGFLHSFCAEFVLIRSIPFVCFN